MIPKQIEKDRVGQARLRQKTKWISGLYCHAGLTQSAA